MSESTEVENLHLRQILEVTTKKFAKNTAIICDNRSISYQELEYLTNQLINYLLSKGINKNSTIGILIERSIYCYIAILAIVKLGATYVPIETDFPDERINLILSDLDFDLTITTSKQITRPNLVLKNSVIIDKEQTNIASESIKKPLITYNEEDLNTTCYIIYTSGSTGKPKGVAVSYKSITHFVNTAKTYYEMQPHDKIYQGFSLAFDASLEEMWMAFSSGATLVVATNKELRSGLGLYEFLDKHNVSVLSTVPTLLNNIEKNIPSLRLLILGGEVCNAALIKQWERPNLKIINTYGPTETTVIATYHECSSKNQITLGKPISGYEAIILDRNQKIVNNGQAGELCIGGIGVAQGYINHPQLTSTKFIKDPRGGENRFYRTGDLAKILENGEIEFHGRIDDQVKLRGFRIELNEIESVIGEYPGVKQSVVAMSNSESPYLIAFMELKNSLNFDLKALKKFIAKRLPEYMVPSFFEIVISFPTLSSGKIDRSKLLSVTKITQEKKYIAPKTKLEKSIALTWQKIFKQSKISTDADFFYDLGGHSLFAAKVISELRKHQGLEKISMLDLYTYPTIEKLASNFQQTTDEVSSQKPKSSKNSYIPSNFSYRLCTIGQFFGCLLQFFLKSWQLLLIVFYYTWMYTKTNSQAMTMIYTFSTIFFLLPILSMLVIILSKWLLLGKLKPGKHKLWGFFYFKWWLYKRIEAILQPAVLFKGSPILCLYYRLLGAKIGKGCFIDTTYIGNPDMLSIGDNSSINMNSYLTGYAVEDGWLIIDKITIGKNCYIGARSVIGIQACINDNAILDDMSLLPDNETIPANYFYTGSPAKKSNLPKNHITKQHKKLPNQENPKRVAYGLLHFLSLFFITTIYYACYIPSLLLIINYIDKEVYSLAVLIIAPLSAILFQALFYLSLCICKKIILNKLKPGKYSIYSLYYLRQWSIAKLLNTMEITILGDSLYFPHLLRMLGANIGKRVELGDTLYIYPDLINIKDEGFTASASSLAWPRAYNGYIDFSPIHIGKRGFIGNDSFLPGGETIGNGGLLGCMSTTPLNKEAAKDNSAWLGSPAIFLPKREKVSAFSDKQKFYPPKKLIITRLMIEFIRIILPSTLNFLTLLNLLFVFNLIYSQTNLTIFLLFPLAKIVNTIGLVAIAVAIKWLLLGKIKSLTKPMWNIFIWKIDVVKFLYINFIIPEYGELTIGTPFISFLLRCMGAKIGKKVYIETLDIGEHDLISIGDNCCLNHNAILQTHLYEDRVFKASNIRIANNCNLGTSALILYDAKIEEHSSLGDFSLIMKGEVLPKNTYWQGIPAQYVTAPNKSNYYLEDEIPLQNLTDNAKA